MRIPGTRYKIIEIDTSEIGYKKNATIRRPLDRVSFFFRRFSTIFAAEYRIDWLLEAMF